MLVFRYWWPGATASEFCLGWDETAGWLQLATSGRNTKEIWAERDRPLPSALRDVFRSPHAPRMNPAGLCQRPTGRKRSLTSIVLRRTAG
jgi:hypothetical protein